MGNNLKKNSLKNYAGGKKPYHQQFKEIDVKFRKHCTLHALIYCHQLGQAEKMYLEHIEKQGNILTKKGDKQ